MPLVVPGINSSLTGDKKNDWLDKLMGKKLSDSTSDEVVQFSLLSSLLLQLLLTIGYVVIRKARPAFQPSCHRAK